MFYDIFENLCATKGITPTQAGRDNGISQGVVSMWKKRGSTPKAETVQKLADYFGVSVDYLLGVQNQPEESMSEIIALRKKMENGTITRVEMKSLTQMLWEWAKGVSHNTAASPSIWAELDKKIERGTITDEELQSYVDWANQEGLLALHVYSEVLGNYIGKLNDTGKSKLIEYAKDLASIDAYIGQHPAVSPYPPPPPQEAAQPIPRESEGKDTPEPLPPPETPENGE